MSLSRSLAELKAALRTYAGFRLFLSLIYFLSLVILLIPNSRIHGMGWRQVIFVGGYWLSTQWRIAEFALIVSLLMVFLTDQLRPLHQKQFGRSRQEVVPVGWGLTSQVLAIASFGIAVYVIPFLNLHIPDLAFNLGKLTWAISTSVPYFALFKEADSTGTIQALSTMAFDRAYFDAATLAPVRSPLGVYINGCQEQLSKGANDYDSQQFIRSGSQTTLWGGIDDLFQRLGNFLGAKPEDITLHERTTDAIKFAVEEIGRNRRILKQPTARVLVTDIEYPGVVDEMLPKCRDDGEVDIVGKIPIKHLICSGANKERVLHVVKESVNALRPDILIVSHVYSDTGYVMDIEAIAWSLPTPKPVLIVDGAQSFGNIEVSSRTFETVDYYAGGVHKWLLVPRNLGLLIRNYELLRKIQGFTSLSGPERPDSTYPAVSKPTSVTINYDPYFGLSAVLRNEFLSIRMNSIATHNKRLVDLFRNEILALGYRVLSNEDHSSVCSVSFGSATEALHRGLQFNGYKCRYSRIEVNDLISGTERESIPAIRFCFHFYHGQDDVYRLLDTIDSELQRARV
jgi:selenocysteine lyase/cysteine desulfurase